MYVNAIARTIYQILIFTKNNNYVIIMSNYYSLWGEFMNIIEKNINFHCPRWQELPDIGLYMDQVVSIIEDHIGSFALGGENKIVTSTMINNYVKQKMIAPPYKKKYQKSQLARLFIICILKRCFSISEIAIIVNLLMQEYNDQDAYDLFCSELENSLQIVFQPEKSLSSNTTAEPTMLQAVMRAFANKTYAQLTIEYLQNK